MTRAPGTRAEGALPIRKRGATYLQGLSKQLLSVVVSCELTQRNSSSGSLGLLHPHWDLGMTTCISPVGMHAPSVCNHEATREV